MTRDDEPRLRTTDVARESGYSVQQVRDLERLGVVPSAVRAANGYRSYAPVHIQALRAYRGLARAAGPVGARRLLAELFAAPPTGELADAAAAIGAVHVQLAREREEVLRAQEALRAIRSETAVPDGGGADRNSCAADVLTITELASALGVRTSTLRFWEQEGLAVPERVTRLRARQYGPAAVREARIVAALRGSGYPIPAVRDIILTLDGADGGTGITGARRILERRLDLIAGRTVDLLRAGADLAAVLEAVRVSRR